MDIIAEILETDRLAEEKLAAAERKKQDMLENTRREQQRLGQMADENTESYREGLSSQNEQKLREELEQLEARQKKNIAALESVFEKNGERWAEDIFKRITAV